MSLTASGAAPRVAFVPHNTQGRDFIVGDLHGCRRDLEVILLGAGFNPHRGDRLFSVGDLVDRGPDSWGCLKLLRQPWFYAVLGNHEQMLINACESGADEQVALTVANGGGWALGSLLKRDPELLAYVNLLKQLPHVLVVGPGVPERFNLVHAALLRSAAMGGQLYRDADLDARLAQADAQVVERLIWSRTVADDALSAAQERRAPTWQEGLSITYCGHSPVAYPVIHRSHCHLDTGAGYEHVPGDVDAPPMRLTVAEHNGGNPIFYTR
jgi:serine/threonine protein phosphatase 1